MSGIFGHLNLSDSDYVYNATQGQQVIYEAAAEWVAKRNVELALAMAIFVEEVTTDHKRRYKLPGGGYLQRLGENGRPGAVKATGQWDVAFPLEDFGALLAKNRKAMAYMTVAELERHLLTIVAQNVNTVRWEILHRLFDNVQLTFTDEKWGSLTVEPLANDDTVTYPPVLGSNTEATEDHYLASAYTAANISDTNNPYVTLRDELEHHFGSRQGGSNIGVFINNAQRTKSEDLTDFDPVVDRFIRAGADTDQPIGLPTAVPGKVLGRVSGVWAIEWRWVPENYMLAIDFDAPAPLIKRVEESPILPKQLTLVSEDEVYPFDEAFWSHPFGLGAGNRLNGAVMFLDSGSSYTIPPTYD